MGKIIIAVLWLAAIILSLCFVYFITCRLRMLSKILSLKKISGVSLKIEYFPALLLPFVTRKPFATARVGGKAYPIRIFSGINGFKAVHIANERYAAIYTRTGGEGLRHTGGRFKLLRRVREPFKIFGARVRVIPPLELDMPRAAEADASFSYFTEAREPQEKIIPALIKLMSGKVLTLKQASETPFEKISIDCEKPFTIDVDGELYQNVKFDVEIVSDKLKMYR